MSYEPHLIAPYKTGLSKYFKPFLIGNDAFTEMTNCYSWRGRITKREGSTVLGRITKWGTATAITNASPPVVTFNAHGLLTGDMIYLENVLTTNGTIVSILASADPVFTTAITVSGPPGIAANQTVYISGVLGTMGAVLNGNTFVVFSVVGSVITIDLDTTGLVATPATGSVFLAGLEKQAFFVTKTGANTFTLQYLNILPAGGSTANVLESGTAVSADLYLPIVGTRTFLLSSSGNEQLIVFTPKQAWIYNTSTNVFNNISFNIASAAILWTGTKDNFFYTSNFASVMWVTNNVDLIRFYNGSTPNGFCDYRPVVSGQTTMDRTLMILPYKGRLVALNTTENGINYYNRARWDQLGTPFAGQAAPFTITLIVPSVSPTVITAPGSNFTTGQIVGLANIIGTVGNTLNGNSYSVTGIDANNFSIAVDTSGKAYTSGGFAQLMSTPATGFSTDVNAWRDDIPGKGGFIDADTSERIVACGIIQDTMVVGFQFSMWRLRYTGNEILPFIWERINTQFGIEGTFTSVEFDEGLLGISRRGIVKASFNDVERIDMVIPDQVDSFENGSITEGLNRIQGIRDYQKRLVYWIYGDQADNAQTPNKILCFNYQDQTWSIFDQSFTTLGQYKLTTDNIWSTWTTPWVGDTSTWETTIDQMGTIIIVAGAVDSRVWNIMNEDVSTDNGVNFNFVITTNLINPYFEQAKRCRLQYYDLYTTSTDASEVTLYNYTDDNEAEPWLERTVDLTSSTSNAKYTRVFLGMIARQHQITITLSPDQLADTNIGASDFDLQGIVFHTRDAGRIKR